MALLTSTFMICQKEIKSPKIPFPTQLLSKFESAPPIKFNPPLWMQRRCLASKILHDFKFTEILDLGCGEGALLEILLNSSHFTKLSGLDIDPQCIKDANFACQPTDYSLAYKRERGIQIDLYTGSLKDINAALIGIDCIVSLEV